MQINPPSTVAAHVLNPAALIAGGSGAAADEQAFARALDRAGPARPAAAEAAPDGAAAAEAQRGPARPSRGASRLSLAEKRAEAHDPGRPPWAAAPSAPDPAAPVTGTDPDPADEAGAAGAGAEMGGQQLLDLAALMSGLVHSRPAPSAATQAIEHAAGPAAGLGRGLETAAAAIARSPASKPLPGEPPLGDMQAASALPADPAAAPAALPAAAARDTHPGAVRLTALAAAAAAAMAPAASAEAAVPPLLPRQRSDAEAGAAQAAAAPAATVAAPPAWSESLLLRTGDAAAAAQATTEIHEAVGTPQFAPALGHRLSLMVRDGIEQARLDLHPADMGPIEVRIRLDGQQAQVEFIAAHALTRQALQEAVPALAGALRESGFTLAGGGVFEQPRERQTDSRGDTARDAVGTTAASIEAAAPVRQLRSRGIVDLYA